MVIAMTDTGKLFGRGIAFPPHIGPNGQLAWSEGETNVREAIRIILQTEKQERVRLPSFGGSLNRYLFEPNTVSTRSTIQESIGNALRQWEPRIAVQTISVEVDPSDTQAVIATITYQLIATQAIERVSVQITLSSSAS
jgi:phage baseplate assembly protein W